MRAARLVLADLLFQVRHGFFIAYAFLIVFYAVLLGFLPYEYRGIALLLIIFTDTAMLGSFFVGAIILLEKGQRTHEALFATPVTVSEFILSKTLSLTITALSMSAVIVLLSGYRPVNLLLPAAGIVMVSFVFTLLGIAIASGVSTVNGYLAASMVIFMPAALPLVDFFGFIKSPLFYLLPSQGALKMFGGIYSAYQPLDLAASVISLVVWGAAAWVLAVNRFKKYAAYGDGGKI